MPRSDSELLRAFAYAREEAAFAELVARRIDFVYAAALRQVAGDSHRARDIAQEVFVKLARNAAALARHPALLGWLCTTTRFAAVDFIRSEQQRKMREREAAVMQQNDDGQVDWQRLQPVLDEALTNLPSRDREVVLARFFDRQPFARIARELGITENAAQRRAERALERLRAVLARRQITSTSAALGAVLAGQSGVAAPAGLAAAITESVLVGTATGAATAGLGIFAFMSTTKISLTLAGLLAALGLGAAYLGATASRDAESTVAAAAQHDTTLASRVRELELGVQRESQRVARAEQENARLLAETPTLTTAAPPPEETITSDMVTQRFRRAQELVRSGDPAEALRELIWCYEVGMPRVGQVGPVRSSSLSLFGRLGERHPPALDWLRERRIGAKQRALEDERDRDSITEYGAMNQALGDHVDTVATMDSLPAGDRRRRELARSAQDYLVDQQRYQDAMGGTSFALISASFERRASGPRGGPSETVATWTAQAIEMLAGSGDLAHARELADRLFKVDGSEATRALIQRHLQRAGHPTLLSATPAAP